MNALNAIAFLIDITHTSTGKGNLKIWNRLFQYQSQITRTLIVISHHRCRAHTQRLLRRSIDEDWLKFRRKNDSAIYILVNPLVGASYIGKTNHVKERTKQHLRYAYGITKTKISESENRRLYHFMKSDYKYHWALIPIAYTHKKGALRLEKRLINN